MLRRVFTFLLLGFYIVTNVQGWVYARALAELPMPGARLTLSSSFTPPLLKGVKLHADNPFKFDFIIDPGDLHSANNSQRHTSDLLRTPSEKLVKYFFAGITIPKSDLWVNLSPYEKGRIIPDEFGKTEMGRDLLAEDYILKQITASLIYPEGEPGREFWKRIYAEANRRGVDEVPVEMFNKVWIVPDKAVVYENKDSAYLIEARLKVMLESDYRAARSNNVVGARSAVEDDGRTAGESAKQILRDIVIPVLEKEVNEGRNFDQLRQVYGALILAAWYKSKIKAGLLNKVYADRNMVAGLNIDDLEEAEKIWLRYTEAFKRGVFNYIKEEEDPKTRLSIPRRYFSGGAEFVNIDAAMTFLAQMPGVAGANSSVCSINLVAVDRFKKLTVLRKKIFGDRIDEWLEMHSGHGKKVMMAETIKALSADKDFLDILKVTDKSDVTLEIIRYGVRKGINFQTMSLSAFLFALRKAVAPFGLSRKVVIVNMSVLSYVQLMTALQDERMQAYLESEVFQDIPSEEKLAAIVAKVKGLNIAVDSESLGTIHTALPQQLSPQVSKKDVLSLQLPMAVYEQLLSALHDERIQSYLESDAFMDIPSEDRLAEIVAKFKELKLPLDCDNLGNIHSALPSKLSPHVLKRDVQQIKLSMVVYQQLRTALKDERLQSYLESDEIKGMPDDERLVGIVRKIKAFNLPLDSDNLGQIFTALPQQLSPHLSKKNVQKNDLPFSVNDQLIAALNDPRVQSYLESDEFRLMPTEERLAGIVRKIRQLKLPMKSENLGNIYSGLPAQLSNHVSKKDVQTIRLSMYVYEQLMAALLDQRMQTYLDSEQFHEIPPEERLAAIIGEIRSLKLPLDTSNYGHIFSALPARLSPRVGKMDIRKNELPSAVYEQVIAALKNEGMQNFLESETFKGIRVEERLPAILRKIREFQLRLDSENLGQIYTALPQQLSPHVSKKDVQTIRLSITVYDQLINGLRDERVQAYLNEFRQEGNWEKIWVGDLLKKLNSFGFNIKANLIWVYRVLPADIRRVVIPVDRKYRLNDDGVLLVKLQGGGYQEYDFSNVRGLKGAVRQYKIRPFWNKNGIESFEVGDGVKTIRVKAGDVIEAHRPVSTSVWQYIQGELQTDFRSDRKTPEEFAEHHEQLQKLHQIIRSYKRASWEDCLDVLYILAELKNETNLEIKDILSIAAEESGMEIKEVSEFLRYITSSAVAAQGVSVKNILSEGMVKYLESDYAMNTVNGGIDLSSTDNQLQQAEQLKVSPLGDSAREWHNVSGFVPVIVSLKPLFDLKVFLQAGQ